MRMYVYYTKSIILFEYMPGNTELQAQQRHHLTYPVVYDTIPS